MRKAPHNDGGPAFPATCSSDGIPLAVSYPESQVSGMTLRDYFAGQALMGILNNAGCFANMKDSDVAENAYHAADAMLAAREKEAA
jgi:hypothetical protein